jgi:hypothetical protein
LTAISGHKQQSYANRRRPRRVGADPTTGSVSRGQSVTRFATDVDPALAPTGRDLIVRRSNRVVEVAGSGNKGAHDGVAYVVTDELALQALVSRKEREVGLQLGPCPLRLP